MGDDSNIVGYIQCDTHAVCEQLAAAEVALSTSQLLGDDDLAADAVVCANLAQLSDELQQEWEFVRQRMRQYSPCARM